MDIKDKYIYVFRHGELIAQNRLEMCLKLCCAVSAPMIRHTAVRYGNGTRDAKLGRKHARRAHTERRAARVQQRRLIGVERLERSERVDGRKPSAVAVRAVHLDLCARCRVAGFGLEMDFSARTRDANDGFQMRGSARIVEVWSNRISNQ